MAYRALIWFFDKDDNAHEYRPGDVYPRDGYVPSAKRLADLLTGNNSTGKPMISGEEPEKEEKPKKKTTTKATPKKKAGAEK